jgi:hypothetical protein
MFVRANELSGYKLEALDGAIGHVKDFYFEDNNWTVRYLVAETGDWLADRGVLLSPYALNGIKEKEKEIPVYLTKKQIEGSPSLETDRPVSAQWEAHYYPYYNWQGYWSGPSVWGNASYPAGTKEGWKETQRRSGTEDPHLRSAKAVTGYAIEATDGSIGHVSDFVIDDQSWGIRYLVVSTGNWWPSKKILVSVGWVKKISWDQSSVQVDLTREAIKLAPAFEEGDLLTRDYEQRLHKHYNQAGYWEEELTPAGVR